MTPPNPLSGMMGSQQPSPQEQPQGPSFLGNGGDPQASQAASAAQSASKQLISEVASVHSSLKGLAQSHPEMADSVDQAIDLLKQGMTKAISAMQSKESSGSQPAYA